MFSESTIGLSRRDFAPAPRDRVRAVLMLHEQGGLSQTYVLRHPRTRIGRESDNEFMVPHRSVSRVHAIARLEEHPEATREPRVTLEDQQSKNGSYVNGVRVADGVVLRNGDKVLLGDVELTFLFRTEQELEAERRLRSLATLDQLSGLLNRAAMEAQYEREFARASRYDRPLSVIMVDLDHFKKINDTYGHLFGDHVIAQTGALLKGIVRAHDIAARYGGEEFSLMLVETPMSGAVNTAERIREAIASHEFTRDGNTTRVTASLGVACYEHAEGESLEGLIRRADKALYLAKHEGRNRVRVAQSTGPVTLPAMPAIQLDAAAEGGTGEGADGEARG